MEEEANQEDHRQSVWSYQNANWTCYSVIWGVVHCCPPCLQVSYAFHYLYMCGSVVCSCMTVWMSFCCSDINKYLPGPHFDPPSKDKVRELMQVNSVWSSLNPFYTLWKIWLRLQLVFNLAWIVSDTGGYNIVVELTPWWKSLRFGPVSWFFTLKNTVVILDFWNNCGTGERIVCRVIA